MPVKKAKSVKKTASKKATTKRSLNGASTSAYNEAMRYYDNAKECILKSGIKDNMYLDKKYIRMAGNTLWNGILEAMDYKLSGKMPKGRKSVEKYQEALGKLNKTILWRFNQAYNTCHLAMGYDGNTNKNVSAGGFQDAKELIEWATK